MCGAPVRSMCFVFRVTTTRSLSSAVAAIRPSTSATGSGTPRSPHRSAMARSTSMMRSRNSSTVRSSHLSSETADEGSRLRIRSMPWRSSPTVKTLRNKSRARRFRNQATTLRSARLRLRSSDKTLVSTRKFKIQADENLTGCGQSQRRCPHPAWRADVRQMHPAIRNSTLQDTPPLFSTAPKCPEASHRA